MPKNRLNSFAPGPAGLTAAGVPSPLGNVHPIVLEASREIGRISRTVRHNGNPIDIGGPSLFSPPSPDRVMNWWRI